MTQEQAISEMLHHVDILLDRKEYNQAGSLLDRILRMDFNNARAWFLLHQIYGKNQPFPDFQRAFAQNYYPHLAHLLKPTREKNSSPQPINPLSFPNPMAQKKDPQADTILCPACQAPNPPSARYCTQCSAPLSERPVAPPPVPPDRLPNPQIPEMRPAPPSTQQPYMPPAPEVQPPLTATPSLQPQTKTCPNCHRENPVDAQLCAYCGYSYRSHTIPRSASTPGTQPEKPKTRPRYWLLDIGLFVVFVSLFLNWASESREVLGLFSEDAYIGFRVLIEFGGGGMINLAVIAFYLAAGAAGILVHASQKTWAVIAAMISLGCLVYAFLTLEGVTGQPYGYSNWLYSDISRLYLREGIYVAMAGGVLVLLGTLFSTTAPSWRKIVGFLLWGLVGLVGIALLFGLYSVLEQAASATPVPTSTPHPTADPNPGPSCSEIGQTWVSPVDGMTQMCVPAGEFSMGGSEKNEKPIHKVYLSTYWIDQTEVTNAMFAQFVAATGYKTEAEILGRGWVMEAENPGAGDYHSEIEGADWRHPTGPDSTLAGREQHPVIHVSWQDAAAYCQWAGRALPTEAQWEKAARGTDRREYPWGKEDPNCSLTNYHNQKCGRDTTAVASYPNGKSPYGAYDMAGNVWEWVSDWYAPDFYKYSPYENPAGPATGDFHVVRGGSWSSSYAHIETYNRQRDFARGFVSPIGFRCAKIAATP